MSTIVDIAVVKLKGFFSLDIRSVSLFRIALGFILLFDLLNRLMSLKALYSDDGVLPRKANLILTWNPTIWSFHSISGGVFFQSILFFISITLAFLLILGFHSRVMAFLSWIMLVSLHNRNPMILSGADQTLRILLFWGIFLPLGARFSLDNFFRRSASLVENTFFSIGTVAIVLQICMIYFFTSELKSGPDWKNGMAVYYTLSLDQYTTVFGRWLYQYSWLTNFLSYFTIYLEKFGYLFLFTPVLNSYFRLLVVILYMGLHFGFGLAINIGFFPVVCMAAWITLIPSLFWNSIESSNWFFVCKKWIKKIILFLLDSSRQEILQHNFRVLIKSKAGGFRNIFCIFCLILTFLYNVDGLGSGYRMPAALKDFSIALSIYQKWNMFAPNPLKDDGWYVFDTILRSGKNLDMRTGLSPVSWEKPSTISFPNVYWHKYENNIWQKKHYKHRYYYAKYLCNHWNSKHQGNEQALELSIYYMLEKTLPNYQYSEPKKVLLWKQDCIKQKVIY